MMHANVSFWLIPAQEDRVFFQNTINTLAQQHNAPRFVPHVTIYSGHSAQDENPLDIIDKATQDVHSVSLHVDTIMYSDEFTKTLFVRFHPADILTTISEAMRKMSAQPSGFVLNPHLSLIYKHMSERAKKALATGIRLPKSEVRFHEVWAITSPHTTQTAADVTRWDVVCRKQLQRQ